MIEAGARKALANLDAVAPYRPTAPITITIELAAPDKATRWLHKAGVQIVEPRRVVSPAADWSTAWKQIWY